MMMMKQRQPESLSTLVTGFFYSSSSVLSRLDNDFVSLPVVAFDTVVSRLCETTKAITASAQSDTLSSRVPSLVCVSCH